MKETNLLTRKINKVILCFICILAIQLQSVAWGNSTDQQKIDSAIVIIKKYGYEKNIAILQGDNYTHKPVKIIFKDLTELNFSWGKHYAISANDNNGDLYILINNNLKSSDVRCLACLILHESNHCRYDKADSVEEEILSHFSEASLYSAILLNDDENLQYKTSDRLVVRENHLKEIVDNSMKTYISGNTTYVNYLKIKE